MRTVIHSLSDQQSDAKADPGAGPQVIAAVDLGSNSFHMIVGQFRHGQLTIIDRLRETVRLSEGLRRDGDLSPPARQRALDCLSRFGERLHDMHASTVRAAGTSSLRRARDSKDFLKAAETSLGHPIEVISGIEEARLIYNGVKHSTPPNDGLRLVLDIGGGSTELILGHGNKPQAMESLKMGCVVLTEEYFPGGAISKENFERARVAARLRLRPVKAHFRASTGIEAIGTSGTIRSTASVAAELGIAETNDLSPASIEALIDRVLEFNNASEIQLPGLSESRAQVWPGGLSILVELLSVLRVDALQVSDGALREGLLYELLGRLQQVDARTRSVSAIGKRYQVDAAQAERVAGTATLLLDQCRESWNLQSGFAGAVLGWASWLHEIGLDIAHDGFNRHGAYVVENADMPGFPRSEQRILAFMIRSQRSAIDLNYLESLPQGWREKALHLVVLLRVAVLLNRSRSSQELPKILLNVTDNGLRLNFPAAWLQQNPLSVADLEQESLHLENAGILLSFGSINSS